MSSAGVGQEGAQADAELRRLLERAEDDDAARRELLERLLERTLYAATWPSGDALRTLRNAAGEQAMALFSGHDTLAAAAEMLGWAAADGSLPERSVHARDALEAGLTQGAAFAVIDLGAPHALELTRDEIALRLAMSGKRAPAPMPSAGAASPKPEKGLIDIDLPFVHGRGERESLRAAEPGAPNAERSQARAPAAEPKVVERAARAPAAEPQEAPTATSAQAAAPATSAGAARPVRAKPQAQPSMPKPAAPPAPALASESNASAGAPRPAAPKPVAEDPKASPIKAAARALATMIGSAGETPSDEPGEAAAEAPQDFAEGALRPLELGLSEAALSTIADALRAFPEVEWACEASDGTEVPVLGVRVSPQFMTRVAEIERAVQSAAASRRAELRVLILSDAAVMREARTHGAAFYPWRKRPGRK